MLEQCKKNAPCATSSKILIRSPILIRQLLLALSPGEVEVRDALLATPNARLIHILPNQISHSHKPDSRFLEPIRERRLLEIGRGNEEIDFARAACLDLNEEIVKIAHAGEGLSLYWLPDGPHRLTPQS